MKMMIMMRKEKGIFIIKSQENLLNLQNLMLEKCHLLVMISLMKSKVRMMETTRLIQNLISHLWEKIRREEKRRSNLVVHSRSLIKSKEEEQNLRIILSKIQQSLKITNRHIKELLVIITNRQRAISQYIQISSENHRNHNIQFRILDKEDSLLQKRMQIWRQ